MRTTRNHRRTPRARHGAHGAPYGDDVIATLENELIEALKSSALGPRVRTVESLPDVSDDSLVKRFATDAPAVYVSYAGGSIAQELWTRRFSVLVLARNARGHKEARHGDAETIGLYELIDAAQAFLDEQRTASGIWYVQADNELRSELLFRANLYGAVIDVETKVTPDPALVAAELDAFERYHAEHTISASADAPLSIEDVEVPQ